MSLESGSRRDRRPDVACLTLRRFTVKIALDYPSPEQTRAAFRVYFVIEPPPEVANLAVLGCEWGRSLGTEVELGEREVSANAYMEILLQGI